MTRRIFTLVNDRLRENAIACVREVRSGSRVEIKGPKRTNDANAAMWCKLGDIAEQLAWHGRRLDTEAWKRVFLDALRRERRDEMQFVPNIDGTGWVDLSPVHSSDLSHEEMGMLLTIISAFGDQNGVVWSEPKSKGDQRPVPPVEAYDDRDAFPATGLEMDDMDEFAATGAPF